MTINKPFIQTRVLVVEDNAIAQKLAVYQLQDLHCVVDVADCGQAALKLAGENRYDLIVMDIGLPDIPGNEVAQAIRQNSTLNKDTPVVALSAHLEADQKAAFAAYGIVDIFTKPLMTDTALQMLMRWVPGYKAESI